MLDLFGYSSGFSSGDRARLRRIEQKLDAILNHLGIAFAETSDLPAEVRALADSGKKIGAIKALREATGLGLADAKREVDAYLAGYR
jgi:ribosomal protein L7/L12